mgnify:FL=1
MSLLWTSPGDDGTFGTAYSYDVRYSSSLITEQNWSDAVQSIGEPSPQPSGSAESFSISSLNPDVQYYFALKAMDNVGNESKMSLFAIGQTLKGTLIYSDNMDNQNDWTVSGTDALWHPSTFRSNSASTSWYYGIDESRDYDTGARTSGYLTSKQIDLSGTNEAVLQFSEWSELESSSNYDLTRVQISVDDALWDTVFESHGTSFEWKTQSVDLQSYVDEKIHLRFWFDSVDNYYNDFEGWYVDDLKILATFPPLPNTAPVSHSQSLEVLEDTVEDITLTASDLEYNKLSFNLIESPSFGNIFGSLPNISYIPNKNYFGPDSFSFITNDGKLNSNTATVSLEILSVNDLPIPDDQKLEILENSSIDMVLSGSDVDDDSLTFDVTTNPKFGSLAGTAPLIKYTPSSGYFGTDKFTFSISDGKTENFGTISIVIQEVLEPTPEPTPEPEPTPKSIKEKILKTLKKLKSDIPEKSKSDFKKVINLFKQELDNSLWVDNSHLTMDTGKKVFKNDKKIIQQLEKIIKKNKKSTELSVDLFNVILSIVESDSKIVEITIQDAEDYSDDKKSKKQLKKAKKDFKQAQKDLSKKKFGKAVNHFEKAWKHTLKTINDDLPEPMLESLQDLEHVLELSQSN